MESFAIVKIKISGKSDLNLAPVLVGPQICVFIFDTAPESFDKYVVDPTSARGFQGVSRFAQAHGIFEQAGEFFSEPAPAARRSELVDLDQFGKQMEGAFLLGERVDR